MAARQLAGRRPLYFTADVSIILLTYLLFSSPNLGGLWADRHQTLPHVRWWLLFLKLSQKFGRSLPPKNLAVQKHQNFGFRYLIANISGREQDIVDRKTALKTAITLLHVHQIWWTLVHKRRKIGHSFRPTQSTFSDVHISAHISGAKGRCSLKISQLIEDDQRLLLYTSLGMGLPPTIF